MLRYVVTVVMSISSMIRLMLASVTFFCVVEYSLLILFGCMVCKRVEWWCGMLLFSSDL